MTLSSRNTPNSCQELISVVVPVYQVEPYLFECVESIRAQTYRNLEIILVDDGSTDGGPAICDGFKRRDDRITVIHQANRGLSAARNAGIESAHGEWLAFVDGDDVLSPNHLADLWRAIDEEGADVAACRFVSFVDGSKAAFPEATGRLEAVSGLEALRRMVYDEPIRLVTAWGKLYRRSLWNEIVFPVGKRHEDEFTVHRTYLGARRIALSDTVTYGYRQRSGSMMDAPERRDLQDKVEAFLSRIADVERCRDGQLDRLLWHRVWRLVQRGMLESSVGGDRLCQRWFRRQAGALLSRPVAIRHAGSRNLMGALLLLALPPTVVRRLNRLRQASQT
ncbi:MAG TPA: glycosyltransferase family 2 protein [Fimbriimonas sp.]